MPVATSLASYLAFLRSRVLNSHTLIKLHVLQRAGIEPVSTSGKKGNWINVSTREPSRLHADVNLINLYVYNYCNGASYDVAAYLLEFFRGYWNRAYLMDHVTGSQKWYGHYDCHGQLLWLIYSRNVRHIGNARRNLFGQLFGIFTFSGAQQPYIN